MRIAGIVLIVLFFIACSNEKNNSESDNSINQKTEIMQKEEKQKIEQLYIAVRFLRQIGKWNFNEGSGSEHYIQGKCPELTGSLVSGVGVNNLSSDSEMTYSTI